MRLGAAKALVVDSPSFADDVKSATQKGLGVQVVVCPVGNSYFNGNVDCLAIDGRYVLYGNLSGATQDLGPAALSKLLAKRVSLLPSTLRSRSLEYKADLAAALAADAECGLSAIGEGEGQIKIKVDEVIPLEHFATAHAKMASNANAGKLVLTVTQTADAIEFFRAELDKVQQRWAK